MPISSAIYPQQTLKFLVDILDIALSFISIDIIRQTDRFTRCFVTNADADPISLYLIIWIGMIDLNCFDVVNCRFRDEWKFCQLAVT